MNNPSAALAGHLAVLSLISFGGIPGVLPDIQEYVVAANGWISERDFANYFAVVQAIPGPNMILMMSFIGWKIGGLGAAVAAGLATFGPCCALSFTAFHFWERFRDTQWQQRARRGLAPVTIGLVTAGGFVMATSGNAGWESLAASLAAAGLLLGTRLNPIWIIAGGAGLGACGVL